MRRLLLAALFFGLATPAFAVPITYVFVQTGQSLPGLTMSASLTIDGTIADLPTINCFPCLAGTVLDFGPLSAFNFHAPPPNTYAATLADLRTQITFPMPVAIPTWSMSPGGISYLDNFRQFRIGFGAAGASLMYVDDLGLAGCFTSTACVVTGDFVATPEPQSLLLLGTGLLVLLVARRARPRVTQTR